MTGLRSLPSPLHAVVIGANGGIGRALVDALSAIPTVETVTALARRPPETDGAKILPATIDLLDEASIAAAAQACSGRPPRLVIVAAGLLHDGATLQPEKSLGDLDPFRLAQVLAINTIGPALVLKHFVPLLPRAGKSVIAVLSARVGSISDNRLGGWYGYRSSKAALNQMLRTASIEVARRWREAAVIGLHPGTVATGLSAPFSDNVPPGKLFTPAFSAARLLQVVDSVTAADTGRVLAWDGTPIPA